jgi:hypothetical protein
MKMILAKIVSGVFNPLLMPTYGLLILFQSDTYFALLPYEAKKAIFIIVLITTCLLPLAFLPLFLYQNLIQSLRLPDIKQRIIPFATTGILYLIGYLILNQMGVPSTIANVLLAGALIIFIALLITLKWKISAHMAGIGSLTGAILGFSFRLHTDLLNYLLIVILLSGLLGSARLLLKHHTPKQVYSGFGLGLMVFLLTFLLL